MNETIYSRQDGQFAFRETPTTSYEEQKRLITQKTTDFIAAATIANGDFPDEATLPRFYPTPFNNFGHYYLFDYERLMRILWDSVELFKSKIGYWDRKLPRIMLVGLVILGVIAPVSLFVFGIVFLVAQGWLHNRFRKQFADIRAQLITRLLEGTWTPAYPNVPPELANNCALAGSGDVEGARKPVVIIFNDQHPFPGFGQLQFEQSLICRPKDKKEPIAHTERTLFEKVIADIRDDLEAAGLQHYNTGHLISLHANSLTVDSPWLDQHKIPQLYYQHSDVYSYASVDPDASARLFFTVQILLPQYMTGASFFLRVYKAENSAACQLSVTTLGPPAWKKDHFQKRLAKYKAEKEHKDDNWLVRFFKSFLPQLDISQLKLFQELRRQRDLARDNSVFAKFKDLESIHKLDLLSLKTYQKRQFHLEYFDTIRENIAWPGQYYYPTNWRENSSLTFPNDFFARPEAIGAVRTLYEQLSSSVLDSFESCGYDISQYKDKEGNYSINAARIDQIIVGEKINVGKSDPAKPEKNSKQPKAENS